MLAEVPFSEMAWPSSQERWLPVPAEPCAGPCPQHPHRAAPLQIATPAQSLLRPPNTAQCHPQPALSRVRTTNNQSFLFSHESINSATLDSSLCSQLSHQPFQALGRDRDTCGILYIKSYVCVNTQMISIYAH